VEIMVWCYVVIFIEFSSSIYLLWHDSDDRKDKKKLLLHLIASLPSFESYVC
jgi:hypothetical protein